MHCIAYVWLRPAPEIRSLLDECPSINRTSRLPYMLQCSLGLASLEVQGPLAGGKPGRKGGSGAEAWCVLQGIRRIVAVTGEEAAAAIKEGEGLANQLAAAQKLQGQQLETEVAALKQVSVIQLWLKDSSFCPEAHLPLT